MVFISLYYTKWQDKFSLLNLSTLNTLVSGNFSKLPLKRAFEETLCFSHLRLYDSTIQHHCSEGIEILKPKARMPCCNSGYFCGNTKEYHSTIR